jgi:5-formyltetrahydrofolate cyclo-ligase
MSVFARADTAEAKRSLRVSAAGKRALAHAGDARGAAARAVRDHFLAAIPLTAKAVIGGYWPIGTELDARPLLIALHERGHVVGLPRTVRHQPLVYHRWSPDDALTPSKFGIMMPSHDRAVVQPNVLILPMLAFDAQGMRVGYGGGYADRTMAELRRGGPVACVGLAYAVQEVERVPADNLDQRLDWIVTEQGARRVERRRFPWLRRFLMS